MVLSYYDSKAFGKVCYGFKRNNQGLVEIEINQAEVVRKIFKMYKEGNSLEDIQEYLFQNNIVSPSENPNWSRDVLNKVLNNFKYIKGIISYTDFCDVFVMKTLNCRNANKNDERYILCQELLKQNCNGRFS